MRKANRKVHLLPLPIATGGIGLLLAAAMPWGVSGGGGFSIGFVVGVAIMLVEAFPHFDIRHVAKNWESYK